MILGGATAAALLADLATPSVAPVRARSLTPRRAFYQQWMAELEAR